MEDYFRKNAVITRVPTLRFSLFLRDEYKDHFLKFVEDFKIPHRFDDPLMVISDVNCIDFIMYLFESTFELSNLGLLTAHRPIECLLMDNRAVFPTKAHPSDIGFDLTVVEKVKDLTAKTSLYDTGLKLLAPPGYYIELVPRSSISKTGYMLANSIGIIDPAYNGNLLVALTKVDDSCSDLQLPAKVAQAIVKDAIYAQLTQVLDNKETLRGDGGFGSSN